MRRDEGGGKRLHERPLKRGAPMRPGTAAPRPDRGRGPCRGIGAGCRRPSRTGMEPSARPFRPLASNRSISFAFFLHSDVLATLPPAVTCSMPLQAHGGRNTPLYRGMSSTRGMESYSQAEPPSPHPAVVLGPWQSTAHNARRCKLHQAPCGRSQGPGSQPALG